MPGPCVTAVIPLHNHEAWINHAIKSVVKQSHQEKKIVVVDDGSTDSSLQTTLGLLQPVHVISHPSFPADEKVWVGLYGSIEVVVLSHEVAKGPSFARNLGVKVALMNPDCRYVALLDSDDMYEQGKVSRSVDIMERFPEVGVVYSDYETLRPDGLRVREFKEPYSRQRLVRECIVNCDSVVSRSVFEAVGLFDEQLRVAEDYDFWLRVSERFVLHHIADSLLTIRVGEHSSSSTVKKEVWEASWRRVQEKAFLRSQGKA